MTAMKLFVKAIQFAAALALAAATLSGCDKSDGGNEVNGGSAGYFRYGDTETPVGKTFAVTDGGKVSFFATPSTDVSDMDAFYGEGSPSYIWLYFDESLATGLDCNLMDEEDIEISGYNAADGSSFIWDSSDTGTYEGGTVRIEYDPASGSFHVELTVVFSTGEILTLDAEAVAEHGEPEETSGIYIINGDEDNVRAVFYEENPDNGHVSLFITSAAIDYFNELDIASSYVEIEVDADAFDGMRTDFADAGGFYEISYHDNVAGTTSSVSSESGTVPTGFFTMSRSASSPEVFSVQIVAVFNGMSMNIDFSGTAKSSKEAVETPENTFVFNGQAPVTILSAILDKDTGISDDDGNDCWRLWLSPSAGKTDEGEMTSEDILIVAPSICFDGTVYGFSMLKDANFYVEYRGVRWVYSDVGEESSTGTIEASVGDGSITLSFYNLKKGQDTLEGYYSGALTIAE